MLVLKLTLVPLLIACVTMIGRRWGARIAGMFAAMPVVAGPIAMFLTLEQGLEFGAHAAVGAVAAVAALQVFFLAYAWASRRFAWTGALGCSLLAWGVVATAIASLPSRIELAASMAIASLLAAPALMPRPDGRARVPAAPPRFDLPVRMLAGALLTLLVTAVATRVGRVVVRPPWVEAAIASDDVEVVIDPSTGLIATERCLQQLKEYFVKGTQPTIYCYGNNYEQSMESNAPRSIYSAKPESEWEWDDAEDAGAGETIETAPLMQEPWHLPGGGGEPAFPGKEKIPDDDNENELQE